MEQLLKLLFIEFGFAGLIILVFYDIGKRGARTYDLLGCVLLFVAGGVAATLIMMLILAQK